MSSDNQTRANKKELLASFIKNSLAAIFALGVTALGVYLMSLMMEIYITEDTAFEKAAIGAFTVTILFFLVYSFKAILAGIRFIFYPKLEPKHKLDEATKNSHTTKKEMWGEWGE